MAIVSLTLATTVARRTNKKTNKSNIEPTYHIILLLFLACLLGERDHTKLHVAEHCPGMAY